MPADKKHILCKIFGHKITQDIIHITNHGSRCGISQYKFCKRCNTVYKTYFGLHSKKALDGRMINFGDMDDKIYAEYAKVVEKENVSRKRDIELHNSSTRHGTTIRR